MMQVCKAEMRNMEVRKVEDEDLDSCDKSYPRFKISFDDASGNRVVFIDKNRERFDSYEKGQIGTLILKITNKEIVKTFTNGGRRVEEITKVEIEDFIVNN